MLAGRRKKAAGILSKTFFLINKLHIVCLDAPAPPDYGGAIDMYYKIQALANMGIRVTLHYFSYKAGRGHQGLERYCEAVHAYPRPKWPVSLLQPYTIATRTNAELNNRLQADDAPILLEGLHTTSLLKNIDPARVVLRMHNHEPAYYIRLGASEPSWLKQKYFHREARLLQRWQDQLPRNLNIAALATTDAVQFEKEGFQQVTLIPCFTGWQQVIPPTVEGSYCLYHGNMSVAENEAAAQWLVEKVFAGSNIPLLIAGKGISPRLRAIAARYPHVALVDNPSMKALDEMVADAKLHVLPSMNETGVKLKILHALFRGRHIVTNTRGVAGSGLEDAVTIADDAPSFREAVHRLAETEFNPEACTRRQALLQHYDNEKNARSLSALW